MAATLLLARRGGFSKTARSGPRLREAGGDRPQVSRAPAIGGRRLADDRGERAAERPEAREADVEADLRDRPVGFTQEKHRALNAAPLQVAVRGLAERRAKDADEMGL